MFARGLLYNKSKIPLAIPSLLVCIYPISGNIDSRSCWQERKYSKTKYALILHIIFQLILPFITDKGQPLYLTVQIRYALTIDWKLLNRYNYNRSGKMTTLWLFNRESNLFDVIKGQHRNSFIFNIIYHICQENKS